MDPREKKSTRDEGMGGRTGGSKEAECVLGLVRCHLGDCFPDRNLDP